MNSIHRHSIILVNVINFNWLALMPEAKGKCLRLIVL